MLPIPPALLVVAWLQFQDPAPPEVHVLEPVEPPAAEAFDGLTIHREPRPLAAGAVVEDWSGFLGPRRDGHSREKPLSTSFSGEGPPLVWEMERGEGFSCPVVAGDRLVFTHRVEDTAIVECLEATTGKRFWQYTFPCTYRGQYIRDGGPRSTPVIAGENVYVHGVSGELFCFELATGRIVWQRDTTKELEVGDDFFGVVASPLVVGDWLVQNVGAPGGPCIAAFDLATGKLAWGAGKEWGPSCASPVRATLGERDLVLVLAGGKSRPPTGGFLALDLASREIVFRYPFRSRTFESVVGSTPVVCDDRVFLTSSYSVGSAGLGIDADGAFSEIWTDRHIGLQFSTPVYWRGRLYAIDGVSGRAGALSVIDPSTGKEVARQSLDWTETVDTDEGEKEISFSVGEGSILVADGHLLVLGDSGHLLSLKPADLEVVSRAALFRASESWTPLALSHGLLYVCQNTRARFGTSPPRLLCYDLRGK